MHVIDIHTHKIKEPTIIQILNIFAQDLPSDETSRLFSAGLHPWHIGKVDPEQCFQAINGAAEEKNMLAIGECGLDRSIRIAFELQECCFREQIQIAENHHKPLIIHCVRAYSDLLKLKKNSHSSVPWIIHGYQGNLETSLSLLKHEFYFSVGEQLLNDKSKIEALRSIPFDRLFLETDESKLPISTIYSRASQVLELSVSELSEIIASNFKTIFDVDTMN